jgi:hypothetical protein
VHHARGVVLDRAQSDETFAEQPLARIGFGELLKVGVKARLRLLDEEAGCRPIVQVSLGESEGRRGPRMTRTAL